MVSINQSAAKISKTQAMEKMPAHLSNFPCPIVPSKSQTRRMYFAEHVHDHYKGCPLKCSLSCLLSVRSSILRFHSSRQRRERHQKGAPFLVTQNAAKSIENFATIARDGWRGWKLGNEKTRGEREIGTSYGEFRVAGRQEIKIIKEWYKRGNLVRANFRRMDEIHAIVWSDKAIDFDRSREYPMGRGDSLFQLRCPRL